MMMVRRRADGGKGRRPGVHGVVKRSDGVAKKGDGVSRLRRRIPVRLRVQLVPEVRPTPRVNDERRLAAELVEYLLGRPGLIELHLPMVKKFPQMDPAIQSMPGYVLGLRELEEQVQMQRKNHVEEVVEGLRQILQVYRQAMPSGIYQHVARHATHLAEQWLKKHAVQRSMRDWQARVRELGEALLLGLARGPPAFYEADPDVVVGARFSGAEARELVQAYAEMDATERLRVTGAVEDAQGEILPGSPGEEKVRVNLHDLTPLAAGAALETIDAWRRKRDDREGTLLEQFLLGLPRHKGSAPAPVSDSLVAASTRHPPLYGDA